eukprot:scaffold23080_cov75-Attheya_sp.AAC.5
MGQLQIKGFSMPKAKVRLLRKIRNDGNADDHVSPSNKANSGIKLLAHPVSEREDRACQPY